MGHYTFVRFKCTLSKRGAKLLEAESGGAGDVCDISLPPRCNAWRELPRAAYFKINTPPDGFDDTRFRLSRSEDSQGDDDDEDEDDDDEDDEDADDEDADDEDAGEDEDHEDEDAEDTLGRREASSRSDSSGWQWEVRMELKNYNQEVELFCDLVLPFLIAGPCNVRVWDEGGRNETIFILPEELPCDNGPDDCDCEQLPGEIPCKASPCGCPAKFCIVCEKGLEVHKRDCALSCTVPWTPQNHSTQPTRLQEVVMCLLFWSREGAVARGSRGDRNDGGAEAYQHLATADVEDKGGRRAPAPPPPWEVLCVVLSFLSGADFGY